MSHAVEKLIKTFSRMPGIGEKTAGRLTYFLLKSQDDTAFQLADSIREVKEKVGFCKVCHNLTEDEVCDICRDPMRDRGSVCIVEEPSDIRAIEASGSFRGLYHVLGGSLSPLDGRGPENLNFNSLTERLSRPDNTVHEVIVATNPSVEGEATALYVKRMLGDLGIDVTRIACGLPAGGHLEYADSFTISQAFQGRRLLDRN